MLSLLVTALVIVILVAIVCYAIGLIPLPPPLNWVRILLYCVIAIILVVWLARMSGLTRGIL